VWKNIKLEIIPYPAFPISRRFKFCPSSAKFKLGAGRIHADRGNERSGRVSKKGDRPVRVLDGVLGKLVLAAFPISEHAVEMFRNGHVVMIEWLPSIPRSMD
jgi:hypothetical protein